MLILVLPVAIGIAILRYRLYDARSASAASSSPPNMCTASPSRSNRIGVSSETGRLSETDATALLTSTARSGQTGAAPVDAVDMVMFTGSVATGKKIMAQTAETLTPVSLELGGKDPMIVLEDADVERAANAAVYYGFSNSGQVCQSVERV